MSKIKLEIINQDNQSQSDPEIRVKTWLELANDGTVAWRANDGKRDQTLATIYLDGDCHRFRLNPGFRIQWDDQKVS